MAQTFQTGFSTTLAAKLNSTDVTATVATAPTVTKGRFFVQSGNTKAWFAFTGVSGTTLTGLTFKSQTADPSTTVTGQTFSAGTKIKLVAMHDQMSDKQEGMPVKVYATTTTRDADITSPSNGMSAYVTASGTFTDYIAGAWANRPTSAVSDGNNASATVAGRVEIATTAQSQAGTDTGETGALLTALPSDIAKNTQSGTFVYGADAGGDDTYVVALNPILTSYTTGQTLNAKVTTANTGACSIDFGPGLLNIKTRDGTDPVTGQVYGTMTFRYDGTNAVIETAPTLATDAEAITGTNIYKSVTPKQLEDKSLMSAGVVTDYSGTSNADNDVTVTLTFQPRLIKINYWVQGHTSGASTNIYVGTKGMAVYEGTTLKYNKIEFGINNKLTGDNGTATATWSENNSSFNSSVNLTTAPSAGSGGADSQEKKIELTINAVSATGFVIRRTTTGGTTNTARAIISWEAYA